MKTISMAALLLSLTFAFANCKKEKIDPNGEVKDVLVQKLQGASDQTLAAVMDAVQQALAQLPELNDSLAGQPVGTCPKITFTPASETATFPATIKLDFGTGCTSRTGNEFAGSITVVASGKVDVAGTSLQVSFSNLKVDGYMLDGKMGMTMVGANFQKVEFSVSELSLTNADGKKMTLSKLDGSREQTAGLATSPATSGQSAFDDDAFDIQFSGKGVDAEGKNFTLETTADLQRIPNCRYLVSGKVVYKVGVLTNSADYGDGTCDNKIKVTVAGVTKEIELP